MSPAVITSACAIIIAIVTGVLGVIGQRGSNKVVDDANLRDDQREYIITLRQDNVELRDRLGELERKFDELRKRLFARDRTIDALTHDNENLRRRLGEDVPDV